MKKKMIINLIIVSIVACTILFAGCGRGSSDSSDKNSQDAIESETEDRTNTEDTESKVGDSQKIGSEDYGYVNVPSDWVKFTDLSFAESGTENPFIAYSNPLGTEIINMLAVASSEQTAEGMASNLYVSFESEGYQGVTGARVNDTGYEGFQVYGISPEGIVHVVWTFDDNAGKVHYISVEGTAETEMSVFDIPKTFSLQ